MSTVQHTYAGRIEGPLGSDNYLLVIPDRRPITHLLSVSVDPGGPVDLDWCDIDQKQELVIIPKIILPPDARMAQSLGVTVEYETPESEPATA